MKKSWLTRFIVLVYCASIVIGCRTTKQRPIVDKNDDSSDRQKRGMVLHTSATTYTPMPGSNEIEQGSTTVINEIKDNTSMTDTKSNPNTTNILQQAEFNEDNRSEGSNNPLPSSDEDETDEIKSRKTRQKSYKCYCEEASYRSDCLKKCQSAKQFVKDDYAQDASIEMTEDPLEGYTNKVPRTTTESTKFSIPYAKNVNFDQKIILGDKYPPSSYSLYSSPQIKIPKNHLFPIYPQTPHVQYAIAYPRMMYNRIPPIKQNYLASTLKKPVGEGTYTPSSIGRNFANIQECIKLYGQTVCVIAPTTKSPLSNSEITTTVDFMTGNFIEKKVNEIDGSCADNNQNQNMKSAEPNQLIYQTNTISPLYEIKYPFIHDPKLKASMKIDKLYSVGSNPPKLPNYYVGNKQPPYANHFNYDKNIFLNNVQNKNLQKSFNGKYYLNKNDVNVVQATSPNKNGVEKQLYYLQTLGITTPRPITQKPVYATKYPFPTTPSYAYLDKSRNNYSKEIVTSKESKSDVENKKTYEYSTNYNNDPQHQIVNQNLNSKNSENSYNYYQSQLLQNSNYGSHFASNEVTNGERYVNDKSLRLTQNNAGQNYLQDTNILQQTLYPPYTQQSNHDAAIHSNSQNYYFENEKITTGYPVQYLTTVPNNRYDYVQNSKFVTNQPMNLYNNEYKKDQAQSILNEIQSIADNKYAGSQEKGISNIPNLLEHTTITPPLLHPTSTYVIAQQKSDYHDRYETNVVSASLQKNYQKTDDNNYNYNLPKANDNFVQGLLPSNTEKDKKLVFSNEYNSNSATHAQAVSSEINSHTSNYKILNRISEKQSIEQTTESDINIQETYQPNYSKDRDSSRIITSIRKEYDSDNSKPISYSHDLQRNHQATYENINYYKSDSAQSKNNELYYSSNEALEHENYKNNERPQPQFDYSNFPQSMSRIINGVNGQYINNQYPQYRLGNTFKKYPNNHIYDSNDKNMHSYYNYDPSNVEYDIHVATPATPIHFNDNIAKTVIPKIDPPDPTSFVDQNIPTYTTASISHTPPSLSSNNKVETAENQENYYPTTYAYDVRNRRPPSNYYEYQDRYNTQLPLQSFNLKKQDMFEHPEQFDNAQIPDVKSNSKFTTNTYAPKTDSDLLQGTVKPITTLQTLENDQYKKHYSPVEISTVRYADDAYINAPSIQSRRKYPSRLSKQKIRLKMMNDTENLFRGLEQIILNNYDPILSEENTTSIESSPKQSDQRKGSKKIAENILFGNFNENIKENIRKYGQAGVSELESSKPYMKGSSGTANPIQSVDDIPATVRENIYSELTTQATIENNETLQQTINESLLENTIRKVINNFVPGKAEDLMANYGNKNAKEMLGSKVPDLLPEIVGTPVIRNLLSIPEIENMIVDLAGGLVARMTNIFLGDIVSYIRKSFRHVVNNNIPHANPTMVPFTVEEHRFQNGEWVTEQVSLLGNSKTDDLKSLPREVFDKIKSILSRSRLSEEDAAQPIVQNLIVKAVKHYFDKERGIVQESVIQKAFKLIIKPIRNKTLTTSSPSYKIAPSAETKKATIPEPEVTTASYGSYKLAPVIPITENNYRNGHWKETQKLLVDPNRKKSSSDFDEKAKKAMQNQLNKVKKIKVTSEEKGDRYTEISDTDSETPSEYEYEYEDEDEDEDEGEYSVIEGNAKEKVSSNNTNDETLERQPIKYYSPNDRILEYIKTHQNALHPSFSTTAEIIGRTNEYDTTTPMSDTKGKHSSRYHEPGNTENLMIQNNYPQQSNRNQLNLLFDSPKDILKSKSKTVTNNGRNLGQTNQFFGEPLTEYSPQSANNLQTYMGRLVPVDEKASQAKDLSDLQNSNLVYVGDGVRLPLTIRKLSDGTFALTLSDEVCKQFLQKQCPCCLPNNSNGFIVREQKSIKDIPEWIISNNMSERTTEKISSNTKSHSKLQKQYEDKELSEITPTTEDDITHVTPHSEDQKESTDQIEIAPSKVEQNLNTKIYSRIRRESEEQKEAVQAERLADRENFVENNIETSTENKDEALLVSLQDKSSNEKTSQQDKDNKGLQIDNNESESFETQLDYEQEEPFDLGLHVIPRIIGPYRYQQLYAKENADALRNMFYMMQGIDSDEK